MYMYVCLHKKPASYMYFQILMHVMYLHTYSFGQFSCISSAVGEFNQREAAGIAPLPVLPVGPPHGAVVVDQHILFILGLGHRLLLASYHIA